MAGGYLGRLAHVAAQLLGVVDDGHSPPTQHVAGPYEQREPDAVGHAHGIVERGGIARRRIRDSQAIQHAGEPVTILGKVDRIGRCSHDGHAGFFERACQLQRRLPA